MTGLVRKYLKTGYVTPVTVLLASLFMVACGFIVRVADWYGIIVFAFSSGFAANFFIQFLTCGITKSGVVIPVKTAKVELARYLSTLAILGIVLVICALYTLISHFTGVVDDFYMIVVNFTGVAGLFFWTGAWLFPTIRLLNANRNMVALAIIYAAMLVVYISISAIPVGFGLFEGAFGLLVTGCAFGLFVASYFLSLAIYRRKLRTKGVLS